MADPRATHAEHLRAWRDRAAAAHASNPGLRALQDEVFRHEDAARAAARHGGARFEHAQNALHAATARHAMAVEAHVGPKPQHPHDLARAAAGGAGGGGGKKAAAHVLQQGKRGGAFYVGAGGRKVYVGSKGAKAR